MAVPSVTPVNDHRSTGTTRTASHVPTSMRARGVTWAVPPVPRLPFRAMTIMEHDYGIPSEDELAHLVGAATPHFALQIRERVAAYAESLPEGHPRLPALHDQMVRLDRLAVEGATGPAGDADLPGRPSLE